MAHSSLEVLFSIEFEDQALCFKLRVVEGHTHTPRRDCIFTDNRYLTLPLVFLSIVFLELLLCRHLLTFILQVVIVSQKRGFLDGLDQFFKPLKKIDFFHFPNYLVHVHKSRIRNWSQ